MIALIRVVFPAPFLPMILENLETLKEIDCNILIFLIETSTLLTTNIISLQL